MEARREATADERRQVVAALLVAASSVNGGADVGASIRSLLDAVRAVRTPDVQSVAVIPEPPVAPAERPAALVLVTQEVLFPELVEERPVDPHRAAVVEVFRYWREATNHTAAKASPERIQKIRSRLADGYSVRDMKLAIDGCVSSPHHRGENDTGTKYDDITLILRTGSKLEAFREMAGDSIDDTPMTIKPADAAREREDREIEVMRKEANRLLKEGKMEEYADAIRSVKQRTANRK